MQPIVQDNPAEYSGRQYQMQHQGVKEQKTKTFHHWLLKAVHLTL